MKKLTMELLVNLATLYQLEAIDSEKKNLIATKVKEAMKIEDFSDVLDEFSKLSSLIADDTAKSIVINCIEKIVEI